MIEVTAELRALLPAEVWITPRQHHRRRATVMHLYPDECRWISRALVPASLEECVDLGLGLCDWCARHEVAVEQIPNGPISVSGSVADAV